MFPSSLLAFCRTSAVQCNPGIAPDWRVQSSGGARIYDGVFILIGGAGEVGLSLVGRVVEWEGLPVDVYVFDPPLRLRQHHHGRCLQLLKPDSLWFKLHWERPAKTFDQARAYVEQLLTESMAA